MSNRPTITCPHCGKQYLLTDEYLEKYGGSLINCARCHNPLKLPDSMLELVAGGGTTSGRSARDDEVPAEAALDVWRSYAHVVVREGCPLPDRCIRCNRPADGRRVRIRVLWVDMTQLTFWKTFWMREILLFALFYFLHKSRTARVDVGMCQSHRLSRRVGLVCMLLGLIGAGALIAALAMKWLTIWAIPLALVSVGVGLLAFIMLAKPVEAQGIGEGLVVLRGAGRPFLDSLPIDPKGSVAKTDDDVAQQLRQM